jgi:uncharacterized membrane protein YraQ (UPF0718 family)
MQGDARVIYLYALTSVALLISLVFSRRKTVMALKLALKKFLRLVPPFLVLTVFIALVLYFVPQEVIGKALGKDSLVLGVVSASLLGAIAFVPGFIVFPLCGLLRAQGVSYAVLSAFTTTLMMVGILTFPVEREYMGTKLAIVRNSAGLIMALIVAAATGLVFGEIT